MSNLKRLLQLTFLLTLAAGSHLPGLLQAQDWPEPTPPTVDYTITVRLDPALHLLHGTSRLIWSNHTDTPASEMPLHLYLNAFRNNRSTFMQEAGVEHRSSRMEEGQWGWVELESITVDGGADLSGALSYAHPDDDNDDDRTVVILPLGRTVAPGESVRIDMTFLARLPYAFARTGAKGNFFMAAQWFPKAGVFQGEEGWNCHQFHANTEFFADFGRFDVTIRVPEAYIVGATGRRVGQAESHDDGTVSQRFIQDGVHDFAWSADPDFVETSRQFIGTEQGAPSLPTVDVTLLLQPEHAYQEDRIYRAAFAAIRDFGLWYGPYPYDTLTIIDPQHGARGAGGMEYPTLFNIGSDWVAPAPFLNPESVTIHEFGHQYWYGLVASNEFEESWLDEGLTSYATARVLEGEYGSRAASWNLAGIPRRGHPLLSLPAGPGRDRPTSRPSPLSLHLPPTPWNSGDGAAPHEWFLLHRLGLPENSVLQAFREVPFLTYLPDMPTPAMHRFRSRYLRGPDLDHVVRPGWQYRNRTSYGLNSYDRPALILATLERLLGPETMTQALRTYQRTYRYRHPTTRDFQTTMAQATGQNLDWLLQPLLHGNGILDYAVDSLSASEIPQPQGVFGHGEDMMLRGDGQRFPGQPEADAAVTEEAGTPLFRNEVVVRRLGSISVPVVIEVEFDDGQRVIENWDGRYPWTRFVYEETRQVVRATVDPERIYLMDINWSNNSRAAERDLRPARRWSLQMLLWMQHVLSFYGGLA